MVSIIRANGFQDLSRQSFTKIMFSPGPAQDIAGTLGILLRAKVEGRIPRIEPIIEHLNRLGFRLTAETHEAVLRKAGE